MGTRAIKDVTKALQSQFSASKSPLSLPAESRRMLQGFIDEQDGKVTEEDSARASLELKTFWDKHVGENPQKLGVFVGVLRELRPAILGEADILYWSERVAKPVIRGTGYSKHAQEDARDFLVSAMVYDDDDENASQRAKTSSRLCKDLLDVYMARSRGLTASDPFVAPDNMQVMKQAEDVLTAFGRKRPKDLFNSIDDLVKVAGTRLQALTLLNAFLQHQTPHLYLVMNTPLVERLLKCLMNDTSTTTLSVAITSLIMLLPHIPGSLGPYLPRLFLIYSRLLCWEKFSELSTEAQRTLVTDDRISRDNDDEESGGEPRDIGIDLTWEKARPPAESVEANTPELLTYFTYLYGLYPLNFMSYIRKSRRYLKNVEFPGADDFDLDQGVIRARTEQFRQMHLMHPNFYTMTVEEELIDPKWPKMDPADVVGECQALCVYSKTNLMSPGPPPRGKLPDLPSVSPLLNNDNLAISGPVSPVASHASQRSGGSWRDTSSTAVSAPREDSPVLKTPIGPLFDDETLPDHLQPTIAKENLDPAPQTNVSYLQREITLLRNDLNFERWHKTQYSQHISQIMRRNVKEATVEAETLNLINANRALKKQLEQVQKAREATIKDSTMTRKQANNLESDMTERFNKLKLEQETWQADADELRRLRSEMKQYRDLLVTTEARELNKSHQLELAQRDLEELGNVRSQLQHSLRRLHEYEYREFDFETAVRERDRLRDENEMLGARLERNNEHRERMRQAYADKIAELESQVGSSHNSIRHLSEQSSPDTRALIQHAINDSESKLSQLKKTHSRLLEKYTELELQLESIRSGSESFGGGDSGEDYGFDLINDYTITSPSGPPKTSQSDRSGNRRSSDPLRGRKIAAPLLPSPSSTTINTNASGRNMRSLRPQSVLSGSSLAAEVYNPSLPLTRDEAKSSWSDASDQAASKKVKIQPDSTVRVYGRGGAQNIKLKNKNTQKPEQEEPPKKTGGFKGLRNLV